MDIEKLKRSSCRAVLEDEKPGGRVEVVRRWDGCLCRSKVINNGPQAVPVREVILADVRHRLPGQTSLYGEGFTMLSQTGGTLGSPVDLTSLTDRKHYRIPQPEDATTVYNLLMLTPPGECTILLAFTSCRRFVGRFYLRPESIQVAVDCEGLTLRPGEAWELEELMFDAGGRESLLAALGERIARHHRPLRFEPVPTGWCSWYCYGAKITAGQVLDNLDVISRRLPGLKYVQIDDGYQAAMGDWLETGGAFGGDIIAVLKQIRAGGLEPAIWVAPFIAEESSRVFREHPDWFIKDASGGPLRSDLVTFGGWRRAPWYALDGTHPQAQEHLAGVFRAMRQEWGCTYFKLDANFWGAMHGGRFHDPSATRVQAYRRGMEAVLRGAGDSFILGCNHPLWPSLGLIHGSRSSNDISRNWQTIAGTGIENLSRNWQNGRLWWNDGDCVVLTGDLPDNEFMFHATAIYSTGGMTLSGDDLTKISPHRLAVLNKLLPPTGVPASFQDESFRIGIIRLKGRTILCVFNWQDRPQTISVPMPHPGRVMDFWTDQDLGRREGCLELRQMPAHSARLLACEE